MIRLTRTGIFYQASKLEKTRNVSIEIMRTLDDNNINLKINMLAPSTSFIDSICSPVPEHQNPQQLSKILIPTPPPSEHGSHNFLTRSKKIVSELDFEISFESGLLQSHKKAFWNIFTTYTHRVEKLLKLSKEQFILTNLNLNLNQKPVTGEEMEKIIGNCSLLSKDQKQQCVQDFKTEAEFCKFIVFALNTTNSIFNNEIIFLFIMLWEEYLRVTKSTFKVKNIVHNLKSSMHSKIEDFLASDYFDQITYFKKLDDHEKIKIPFLKFLCSLAETIVLIVQGYYDNPYEQIEENEEEDEGQVCIRKLSWLSIHEDDESEEGSQSVKRVKTMTNS